ncbi:hypothetical protein BJ944DRAFT_249729 [Cunninghamella echinulata]|nr:hypothetical protein BJ944DRAFT_249729 [Cunninghamella echinulata]
MKSKTLLFLLVSIATLVKSAEESSNIIKRSTSINIINDDITNPSVYPSVSSSALIRKRSSEEGEKEEKEKDNDIDENKKKKKKNNNEEVEDNDKKKNNTKDKGDQDKKKNKNEDEVKHKIVYLTPPSSEIHQARVANNHNKNNYNPDSISPGKADDDQQKQQQIPPPQLVDNNDRSNQENKDSQNNTNELNKQLNDSNDNGPQGIGKIGTALLSVGGILMVACIAGGILVWKTYQHHRLPFSRQQPPSLSHQDEKFFEASGGIPPPPPAATTGSMMINRPKSKQSSIVDIESISSNHHHQQYNPSINVDSDLHLSQSQASYMMNWQNELNFNYSMEKLFKNTRESKLTHSQSESNIPQDCKIKIDLIHKDI